MLAHPLRRCPNVSPTLGQRLVCAGFRYRDSQLQMSKILFMRINHANLAHQMLIYPTFFYG